MKKYIYVVLVAFLFAAVTISVDAKELIGGESMSVQTPHFAYVGSYTSKERGGHGTGIEVFSIEPKSGQWESIQNVEAFNPAFLAMDSQKRFLYAVHGDGDYVSAFSIDPESGKLTMLNSQLTGGKNGAHLIVDPSDRFLLAANNSSGNISVFPINQDGTLVEASDVVALTGKVGPNRTEQASSHPHQVRFDPSGKFVIVTDVGLDTLFVYHLDIEAGKLTDCTSIATRAGAGPRHLDFHPDKPYAYVINGLDSTVATYTFDNQNGTLTPIQIVSTLPPTYVADSAASEIMVAPSGNFVYGANRIASSIAVYAVNQNTGMLTPAEYVPTQGKAVRFFTLDPAGKYLYAGNMANDTIVVFRVDQAKGTLNPSGQVISTGSPACIIFK